MKNDTSAILVGIEKLEMSLENGVSSSGSSGASSSTMRQVR